MKTTTDAKATAFAGTSGTPGSRYQFIEATMRQFISGGFELLIHAERGSNQGHLEEHDSADLCARGSTVEDCIDELSDDVCDWDDWLTLPERRQLLRDIQYDADDTFQD